MKKNYVVLAIFATLFYSAQTSRVGKVGVNTTTPEATLDINGNLMVRTVPVSPAATTYDILVVNPTTSEVQKINGNLTGTGSNVNSTIAKAVEKDGVSLLSGSAFAGWQKIDFGAGHVPINPGGHFDATTDFYTVPSTGIYEIFYEFRYGEGVLLSALNFNGTPSIGILNHGTTGYTVLDERKFSGASVPLVLSAQISSTAINSVYKLTAGDKLSFELNAGGLNLNLLSSSFASVVVKKISD